MTETLQPKPESLAVSKEEFERAEAWMLRQPQASYKLHHRFAPGIYIRHIIMEPGVVMGHEHITTHFNMVLRGKASVYMDGEIHHIEAPYYCKSEAGVRKVLMIEEEMEWLTIHPNPTNETDIEKLEDMLRIKSETFKAWETEMNTHVTTLLKEVA